MVPLMVRNLELVLPPFSLYIISSSESAGRSVVPRFELDKVQRFDYGREFLGYTQRKSTACQCAHTEQHWERHPTGQ
jgi:hypothetical protein